MTLRATDPDRPHPGAQLWGEPCSECGYSWTTSYEDALDHVAAAPTRFGHLIMGHEEQAMTKPQPGVWSPSGYVWHTSDWFRIRGQRIYALDNDPLYKFVPLGVEQDELGTIFKYDELPPRAGLWSLEWAANLFLSAARDAARDLEFNAQDGTHWSVEELVVWVGHESVHHELDVRRGLDRP